MKISLPVFLFIIFMILKLTNTITWSWWWITAPLWAIPVFIIGLLVIVVLAGLGLTVTKRR